jgi:peptide deformylase
MAVRNILTDEDPLLRKTSREVSEITPRIETLIEDMLDTLYETGNGIGLAAPQVGVLRRIFVIDLQEDEESQPLVFINPEIYETDGSQVNQEGCLSVPGRWGEVERPAHLRVRALNAKGEPFDMEATGLLATCICHENDHLDGILFTDKVIGELDEA